MGDVQSFDTTTTTGIGTAEENVTDAVLSSWGVVSDLHGGTVERAYTALRMDTSTDTFSRRHVAIPKIIPRPMLRPVRAGRSIVHESWEGVVEEIYDTYFVAQLVSASTPNVPECAEIYSSEVSPADRPLLRIGAVFYWTIGYSDSPSGQRSRSSLIRFRRLPSLPRRQDDAWIGAVRQAWQK